jgi:hypothetical protein
MGESHESRMPARSPAGVFPTPRLPKPLPFIISLAYDFTNVSLGCQGEGLKPEPSGSGTKLGASTAHFAQVSPSILQETASPPPRGGFFEKGRELNLLSGEISGNSVNFWESPSRWRSKERARGLYPIFFGWELLGQNWKKTSGEGKFTGKANYPGGKPGPLSIREAGENTFSERSVSHGAVRNSCKGPLLV